LARGRSWPTACAPYADKINADVAAERGFEAGGGDRVFRFVRLVDIVGERDLLVVVLA
jgi:hypothetical protein